MDLPNNADIVSLPAHNLYVIPIHNYLCCMGVLCTWVKMLTDFGLGIAQKCVWRSGSARTRWGSYSAPRSPSRYKGEEGGKGQRVGNSRRGGREGKKDVKG